jgi:hypothetical protein
MMRTPFIPASESRRGVVLLVVLVLLTLFAVVGLSFVLYANSAATSAQIFREAETQDRADVDPELLLSYFLGQLVYDVPDDEKGVYSGLRGHSLARSMYGYKEGDPNDVPFNGTGRLVYDNLKIIDDDGKEKKKLSEYDLINYTFFRDDLQRKNILDGQTSFLHDPEYYGYRKGLNDPQVRSFVGGFNAPYTYPDLNNFYLAAATARGGVLTPSFHRHWLFNYPMDPDPSQPDTSDPLKAWNPTREKTSLHRSNPHWLTPEGKYLILRPRPIDHLLPGETWPPKRPYFDYPEDEGGDVKNLIGVPGYYHVYPVDLKNPSKGVNTKVCNNDSVWLDLDFPVMTAPDGRKFKPLFAPLIVDLDNRINVNAHGNLRGLSLDHASNQGWGPWEVNLAKVLDHQGNPTEWQNLLHGDRSGSGRYGRDNRPHSALPGNQAQPGITAWSYAPVDFDGSQENNQRQPTAPLILPDFPLCFPSLPAGYGNASDAECKDHPSLYNPGKPTLPDRSFALSNIEALLRYGDTGSPALTSELLRLCPQNLSGPDQDASRRRRLLTTHSSDLDQPGLAPWISASDPTNILYDYEYNTSLLAAIGNGIPFPDRTKPLDPKGEFGQDWRADPLFAALKRINLNRNLSPYPTPDSTTGRFADKDLAQFQQAQGERQQMAKEIFELLQKVTGADPTAQPDESDTPAAGKRWLARRWLAQIAVNIVDFIDSDDYMTPFNWYPPYPGKPEGEWVFGTELPRVVLNEAYVEATGTTPAWNVSVWVELFNPLPADSGAVKLNGAYALYLTGQNSRLREAKNVRGDPDGQLYQILATFAKDSIQPLPNGVTEGVPGDNLGYYVLGPRPLPGGPDLTMPDAPLSYNTELDPVYNQPTLLLRRLACPHLAPNPPPGGILNPALPYNPYVTVDYMEKVPVNIGSSIGRVQPYDAIQTVPQTAGPTHTFFRPNIQDPLNPAARKNFDWLVHLDRKLVSPLELLYVSAFKPHELTHQFVIGDGTNKHRAPWLDERIPDGGTKASNRLYRALEFLGTRDQSSERLAGKININTIWDPETFLALCDPQTSNAFNGSDVKVIYDRMIAKRTPSGQPDRGDKPFRSLTTGLAIPPDISNTSTPSLVTDGINATFLGRSDSPSSSPSLFAIDTYGPHPYHQFSLMTKIFNNVTVRSNVFAVWVTVGFFEVIDDTSRPVKLGTEIGRSENRHVRHRMFGIVDRSVLNRNPGPQPRFDPRAGPSPGARVGSTDRVVPYVSIIE